MKKLALGLVAFAVSCGGVESEEITEVSALTAVDYRPNVELNAKGQLRDIGDFELTSRIDPDGLRLITMHIRGQRVLVQTHDPRSALTRTQVRQPAVEGRKAGIGHADPGDISNLTALSFYNLSPPATHAHETWKACRTQAMWCMIDLLEVLEMLEEYAPGISGDVLLENLSADVL